MKMRTMIFSMALGMALAPSVSAQTIGTSEFDPLGEHLDKPIQVRVITEFFEVSQETATDILSEERKGANDNDLRQRMLDLVKKKSNGARIIDAVVISTRSGQRAKVETIEEKIYPTEYDPPEAALVGDDDKSKGKKAAVLAPPNPTAFEMRPVGVTLEVDPVVDSNGVTVELNIAPEIVYEGEPSILAKWKTKEVEIDVSQPVFYSVKLSTAIAMVSGQSHLAAITSPRNEKTGKRDGTRKVLVFVRADILFVGD